MACSIKITMSLPHYDYPIIKSPYDTLDQMLIEYNAFEFRIMNKKTIEELKFRRDAIFKFIRENHIKTVCHMKNYKLI